MALKLKLFSRRLTSSKVILLLIVAIIYFCGFLSGKNGFSVPISDYDTDSIRAEMNPRPENPILESPKIELSTTAKSTFGHTVKWTPKWMLTEKMETTTTKSSTTVLVTTGPLEANPHPFNFLILETEICKNVNSSSPLLLVVVHSDPKHHDFRTAIRETWANPNASQYGLDCGVQMRIVFALGFPNNDSKTTAKVIEESRIYRDIIQEDFIDTYRNLTHKSVMWLKWVTFYCPNAFHILKIDDDVFVNRFYVLNTIRGYFEKGIAIERTFTCRVWKGFPVLRDRKIKWYVSTDEYKEDWYPTYCPGAGILMSGDLPKLLYQKTSETRFFWIDDVYVTGMLREKVGNITFIDIGPKYVVFKTDIVHIGNQTKNGLYFHLGSRSGPHYEYWNRLLEEYGVLSGPDYSTEMIDSNFTLT